LHARPLRSAGGHRPVCTDAQCMLPGSSPRDICWRERCFAPRCSSNPRSGSRKCWGDSSRTRECMTTRRRLCMCTARPDPGWRRNVRPGSGSARSACCTSRCTIPRAPRGHSRGPACASRFHSHTSRRPWGSLRWCKILPWDRCIRGRRARQDTRTPGPRQDRRWRMCHPCSWCHLSRACRRCLRFHLGQTSRRCLRFRPCRASRPCSEFHLWQERHRWTLFRPCRASRPWPRFRRLRILRPWPPSLQSRAGSPWGGCASSSHIRRLRQTGFPT
jgi:hypothetical protein